MLYQNGATRNDKTQSLLSFHVIVMQGKWKAGISIAAWSVTESYNCNMTKLVAMKWYFISSVLIVVGIIGSIFINISYYVKDPIVQNELNSNNGLECNFSTYKLCPAILNGEEEACRVGDVCQKKRKPETVHIQDPVNCSGIVLEHHFITSSLSQEEASYPLAYIITIHKELEMFVKLLRAIYSPQNVYCIHVDQKSPEDYKRKVKSLADCFDNIFLASKMEYVVYGGFSRLQADINCMKDLVNSKVEWKHVINLCGQDFPIKTNREIIWHIKSKWEGKNITPGIRQPPNMKYRTEYIYKEQTDNGNAQIYRLNQKKTTPPLELSIYFGTAYYALTRKFVQFVLEDARAKALLEWSRDTYSPDEHYWVTLNRLKDAPGATPDVSWEGNTRAVIWAPHVGPSFDGCKARSHGKAAQGVMSEISVCSASEI
ncbi:beta-1,3-galactosyl-O-glycosyl-glycoprotein beta-1,6-N-acetylglucosaminyltransferase 7 isoform X2 [Heptranchias perlo]|uniref:beta-1,3-galactosyl-O-glycosyl-glycoprotein beta-1,6-N-acetylglucosaminyltransferase 7 isoform X2 n=1 Tax=Heptranchias perlo TaxID=212740 RepID=UPI0035596DA6